MQIVSGTWQNITAAEKSVVLCKPERGKLSLQWSATQPTDFENSFAAELEMVLLPAVAGKSLWAYAPIEDVRIVVEEIL